MVLILSHMSIVNLFRFKKPVKQNTSRLTALNVSVVISIKEAIIEVFLNPHSSYSIVSTEIHCYSKVSRLMSDSTIPKPSPHTEHKSQLNI